MKIDTKFDFDDVVHLVRLGNEEVLIPCGFCEGRGHLKYENGESTQCPECYGKGRKEEYNNTQWYIVRSLTIGQIRVELNSKKALSRGYDEDERTYMCYETGVGSGAFYYERDLFASVEEAQAVCDARNIQGEEV